MSKHDKSDDKNNDIARNIWLAGLGAYGRAFDEAVHRYEKASKDSPKLFKDLVKRGQELEKDARTKVHKNDLVRTTSSLEDRIKRVRANLTFGPIGIRDDIERLEKKIDALSHKLDRIATPPAKKKASRSKAKAKRKTATRSNSA